MVDYTKKLGRAIAQGTNSTDELKQEIVPDSTNQNLLLAPYDRVRVRVKATFTRKTYATDSFILDHPTLGILDSSTLKLDGGYADEIIGFSMPVAFPITFAQISQGTQLLHNYYDKE